MQGWGWHSFQLLRVTFLILDTTQQNRCGCFEQLLELLVDLCVGLQRRFSLSLSNFLVICSIGGVIGGRH